MNHNLQKVKNNFLLHNGFYDIEYVSEELEQKIKLDKSQTLKKDYVYDSGMDTYYKIVFHNLSKEELQEYINIKTLNVREQSKNYQKVIRNILLFYLVLTIIPVIIYLINIVIHIN